MTSPAIIAMAMRLLFFASLIFQDETTIDRTTVQLGIELLYFAGTLAECLTHLLLVLIGPPATTRRRELREAVGEVYPICVNLIVILQFFEKVPQGDVSTDPTILRIVWYAKIMSLGLVSLWFGLVLANRIAEIGDEQLRDVTIPAWEIINVTSFLSITMWSIIALNGVMTAARMHTLGGPLLESELEELKDWIINIREIVGWNYYLRMVFMEIVQHEFVLQDEVGFDDPE